MLFNRNSSLFFTNSSKLTNAKLITNNGNFYKNMYKVLLRQVNFQQLKLFDLLLSKISN